MTYWVLAFLVSASVLGGLIAGLTGLGGGVVYVLIYEKFFHLTSHAFPHDSNNLIVKAVIANSVFSITFAGLVGVWRNHRIGHFYPKILGYIAFPALLSALVITYGLTFTQSYTLQKYTIVFALILLPAIVKVLFSKERQSQSSPSGQSPHHSRPLLMLTGVFSGAVTALGGLGGGVVIIPVLNGLFVLPIRKAIAISLGVIAAVSLGLTLYNMFGVPYELSHIQYSTGLIYYPLVIPVSAGVIVSTIIGVNLAQKLPSLFLKSLFVFLSFISIGNLIYDAYL